MDEDPYLYKEVPLSPAIIEELTLDRFAGQLVERQRIVDEVIRVHPERGGKPGNSQSITTSVKKALTSLKEGGFASKPILGIFANWCVEVRERRSVGPYR